jgi:hypothetical protein
VRLRASRPFVVRGRTRTARAAILTFRLPKRGLVVFQVRQLAPVCRTAGVFRVRGHAGANRVRFTGRVRGRLLPPGTYELRARGLPNVRVRIAVLGRKGTARDAARVLKAKSVCAPEVLVSAAAISAAAPLGPPAPARPASAPAPATGGVAGETAGPTGSAGKSDNKGGRPSAGEALGAISRGAERAGPLGLALIIAGIGAAILLLGTASLPPTAARGPWLAGLVADRRLELALAGAVMLLVVTLAYLVAIS